MVSVEALQEHINKMTSGKLDFSEVEMNLRADLVNHFGYPIEVVAKLDDCQVSYLIDEMDCDNEVEEPDHIIQCSDCGADIELRNFTDNPKYARYSSCGWDYECKCGKTGFVWEGAFDGFDEFED